jgi:hypothetical protein
VGVHLLVHLGAPVEQPWWRRQRGGRVEGCTQRIQPGSRACSTAAHTSQHTLSPGPSSSPWDQPEPCPDTSARAAPWVPPTVEHGLHAALERDTAPGDACVRDQRPKVVAPRADAGHEGVAPQVVEFVHVDAVGGVGDDLGDGGGGRARGRRPGEGGRLVPKATRGAGRRLHAAGMPRGRWPARGGGAHERGGSNLPAPERRPRPHRALAAACPPPYTPPPEANTPCLSSSRRAPPCRCTQGP